MGWVDALSLIPLAIPIALIIEPMWLLYTLRGIARWKALRSR